VNWYGICALRMLGLVWAVKLSKLSSESGQPEKQSTGALLTPPPVLDAEPLPSIVPAGD